MKNALRLYEHDVNIGSWVAAEKVSFPVVLVVIVVGLPAALNGFWILTLLLLGVAALILGVNWGLYHTSIYRNTGYDALQAIKEYNRLPSNLRNQLPFNAKTFYGMTNDEAYDICQELIKLNTEHNAMLTAKNKGRSDNMADSVRKVREGLSIEKKVFEELG